MTKKKVVEFYFFNEQMGWSYRKQMRQLNFYWSYGLFLVKFRMDVVKGVVLPSWEMSKWW
jgi:hypothetical protein